MGKQQNIDIQHPEAWELIVAVADKRVDYILYTPSVSNSLIIGQVSCADDSVQALEDAVYDTPVLLNEYKRVRVLVHSSHFVLLPTDAGDDDAAMLVREAFPGDDGDAAVCHMTGNDVKIAFLMPRGMQAFLGRTFNYPAVYHHLSPLCEHFKELGHDDNRSRMFINLRNQEMDLAVYRDSLLQCANTYHFTDTADAAYFAMNAWRTLGLDQLNDELQLMGDADQCVAMTPALREYVKFVMPAVFPAEAMRLGRNAMQAPLELILLALCE